MDQLWTRPSVVEGVVKWYTMTPPSTQQDFLRSAKDQLALDWDTFAVRAGISPRALKSYRLPSSSAGHRTMPDLARAAVEDLLRTAGPHTEQSQQEYLLAVMAKLKLTWRELAEAAGIKPLTFKNYLRADTALAHRRMPALARSAIERLLREKHAKKPQSRT